MATDINDAEVASEAEVRRYEHAYRETRRVLDESIETLAIMEELEDDPARRAELRQQRLQVDTKRINLVRANVAFHAGRSVMKPPSSQLVGEILALSKEAVELTVARATASAILKLTTEALAKFAQIQDIIE